ncbi:MAG TPA: 3'-5' exonuclease [Chondromyces sp.]|nr:3'-5' exonuclease [Chondromyces sp.]
MAEVKQFIFFDFEMLCSNRGMPFEEMQAIRLGAVKYELESEKITSFDRYIRPQEWKPLSRFCTELTGITDKDLVRAKDFKTVFTDFLTWVGGVKRSRFFSWSTSDLTRLKLDAERYDIANGLIKKIEKRYVDFQAIFAKRAAKNQPSVENALRLYNLDFIGNPHNPMHDSYNTLRVYLNFLNKPEETDLIMLKQFIFRDELPATDDLNCQLKKQFRKDLNQLFADLHEICRLKDAKQILKRTKRLVDKYENIIINRSGLFSAEMVMYASLLARFYQDLVITYEEHFSHSSKVMILDEHIIKPIKQLTVSI